MTVLRVRTASVTLVAAALLSLAGCVGAGGGKAAAPPVPDTPASQLPASKTSHVIVIVMENKEQGRVIGSADAPYINRLARTYSLPKRFYGVAHPSLPNYLALLGGSTFGVRSDCSDCLQNGRTLVDQLEAGRVSWRGYMEGMPKPCYPGATSGRYAKKHNPFVYFRRVLARPAWCRKVVPATELRGALQNGSLPSFAWITPDLCNDTHDCSVRHGDRYLAKLVPPLLRELGPHGFLVLTYDEGESDERSGGNIPTVVAGPDVKRGSRPSAVYTHYSTLRTIEDTFGLPHLRAAASAGTRPLDAAFRRAPRFR